MPSNRKLSRRLLALAAGALLVASPARAAATGSGHPTTSLRFTVEVGPDHRTRCTIDADLHEPAGADRGRPVPAILMTNGFGGRKDDNGISAAAAAFAQRGYLVLTYSGLGFGRSTCPISLNDPQIDGEAASRLVDFLAGARSADDGTRIRDVVLDGPGDPRVGMFGGSYGGAVQLATASVDQRLDAIVPMNTWHDLAYSLAPNGADPRSGLRSETPGVYKYRWTNAFFAIGQLDLTPEPGLPNPACHNFTAQACAAKALMDSGRFPPGPTREALAYLESVSPTSYLDQVTTPTLLIQGEHDNLFNLNEATTTYHALRDQGTPVKMIWQSAGHSGGTSSPDDGELNFEAGNLDTSYVGRRILAWFDRYLHHQDTDTGPDFAYYRDWMPVEHRYGTATPSTTSYFLSGDGALVNSREQVQRGSREYRNWPVPGLHDDHVSYTTDPLPRDVDVAGIPTATLQVTSPAAERTQSDTDPAGNLVLFVGVHDVAPDGSQTLINDLIAPVRVPDARLPFTIALPGIAHRFESGHRIRFTVTARDDSYYGNSGIKPVIVTSSPQSPNVLELPVVS